MSHVLKNGVCSKCARSGKAELKIPCPGYKTAAEHITNWKVTTTKRRA